MRQYIEGAGAVSPTVRTTHRLSDVVAALAPPPDNVGAVPVVAAPTESVGKKALQFVPGAVGAGLGYVAGSKMQHPVLGALVGHAVGSTAYGYFKGDRTRVMCQVGVEGAGVAGALLYKRHPVWGWAAGIVAGSVASYFVPGSPCREEVKKLTRNWGK